MTEYTGRQLSDLAKRQLRSLRGARSRTMSNFTQGGLPRLNPKARPAITLRRKDYEQQRGGQ